MRFLVDMNLSPAWVEFLAEASFEAVHWSSIGPIDASDAEVMLWAARHNFVVLTNDLDFGAILAATQSRQPSVILIRSNILHPNLIGSAVIAAIQQATAELASGAIMSIDAIRRRIRILPLSE
jgi:predicted nuclease of predicted toxin-antitoxin system